jgi:TolB protein
MSLARPLGNLCAVLSFVMLIASCVRPSDSLVMQSAGKTADQSRTDEISLSQLRALRLFGESNLSGDISFEGKAAVSIQQHTPATDGADFDPHVDPAGKLLVFGSTRHSTFSHLYVKPVDGATLTQLTDEAANDAQPVFSPDGQRIAFASNRGGPWDIWCIETTGRNPVQITSHPMAELHPSWSPDGREIVYCRLNARTGEGELWITPVDQSNARRCIGDGLFPAWSPTGNRILYQKARQRGSRWFSLWVITLEIGEPTPPTEIFSHADYACIAPSWSADGSQIAFSCVQSPRKTDAGEMRRADISIIDADGRGLMRLTNGRGENYSPCWAADDRIYFAARLDGSETLWSLKPFRPTPAPLPLTPPPGATINRQAAEAAELREE